MYVREKEKGGGGNGDGGGWRSTSRNAARADFPYVRMRPIIKREWGI